MTEPRSMTLEQWLQADDDVLLYEPDAWVRVPPEEAEALGEQVRVAARQRYNEEEPSGWDA